MAKSISGRNRLNSDELQYPLVKAQQAHWLLGLLLLPCLAPAQPEVTFEFESMFGEFGFYTTTVPPNQIPPPGFSAPTGVDWLRESQLIVADRGNRKLQSCDDQGNCSWIGIDGQNSGQFLTRNNAGTFDLPHGIEVNKEGKFAVADEDNHAVQFCNELGECQYKGDDSSRDNDPSSQLGRWRSPADVAFDSENRIHGLDTGNHRIQMLRPEDLFVLNTYMGQGSGLGEMNNAQGIAIDAQDRIIISDTGNHRIQVCELVGRIPECTAFGQQGATVGRFRDPVGVEVDALGRIWVADTGNHRIQVCDYVGNCVAFGEFGEGEGQFDSPHDMAVHPSGRVAVVDTNNNRIQLFRTESAFGINAGINDAWFNPLTPGQGYFITVFPVIKKVFLANFTFDVAPPESLQAAIPRSLAQSRQAAIFGAEEQRWVTAFGDYSGANAVLDVELTTGGVFNSIAPAPAQIPGYGTFLLEFTDCNNGSITYDFPALELSGVISITRLAADNIALCNEL
jgi:DNA-binding beta-propeller fold protein YncE